MTVFCDDSVWPIDIEKYSLSESTKVSLYCDSSVRLVIFCNTFSTFPRSVSLEVFFSFSVTVFVTVDVTVFVTVSVTAKIFRFTSVFVSSDEFIWAVHTCTSFNFPYPQLCANRSDFLGFAGSTAFPVLRTFLFGLYFELGLCNYYFYSECCDYSVSDSFSVYLNAEAWMESKSLKDLSKAWRLVYLRSTHLVGSL